MSEIKVQLDPEDVNRMVTEAVLQSTIGKHIQVSVDQVVQKMQNGIYADNPIRRAVEGEIDKAIHKVVREEYLPTLEELVRKRVTEEFTEDLFTKMWNSFVKKY